jgi:hypothetical protein
MAKPHHMAAKTLSSVVITIVLITWKCSTV